MTRRKKILIVLLIVALAIMISAMVWPNLILEYIFYLFSIPVMVLNMWEWFSPEIVEKLFDSGLKDKINKDLYPK